MCVRTNHDGAINRCLSRVTQEYNFHGLTEEPLTLFPDMVRCPLFTAFPLAIGIALPVGIVLRDERELVGGCQGRKRGT